jgi:hypothetical protein
MDVQSNAKAQNPIVRQLASLKVLSRLLGHELHAQGGSKTVTLSREEVIEIQTTVDLFIEELTRRVAVRGEGTPTPIEPQLVPARN